jgi:hypothetical protein
MNYYEMLLARKLAKGELPPNAYLLKTASGSLVSFADGANLPMPSFICNIDAVQDLHGYDAPWVGGAGKNKQMLTVDSIINANGGASMWSNNSRTINDVTFTILTDSDGNVTGIKTNGTSSATFLFNFPLVDLEGIYTITGCPAGGSDTSYRLDIRTSSGGVLAIDKGNGGTTASFQDSVKSVIRIENNTALNNLIFYPMIRESSQPSGFAPYSNICPISGHTGVDAWVRGKNLYPMLIGNDAFNNNNDGSHSTGANGELIVECSDQRYSGVYTRPQSEFFKLLNTILVLPCNVSFDIVANKSTNVSLGTGSLVAVDTTKKRVTIPFNTSVAFVVYSWSEAVTVTISNFMVSKSSDPTYEPYNSQSQTIQVSWQTEAGEVYGGYVDLVSGVLTVTHKSQTGFTRGSQDSSNKLYNIGSIADIKKFSYGSNISPYFIDNMFAKMSLVEARATETPSIAQHIRTLYVGGYIGKETELDTLLETLQVMYELETPLTYQLTPTQIKSLLGNNNAWCDTGDVTLEYFGKGAE